MTDLAGGPLIELADQLPPAHRAALQWFDEYAGRVVPWPGRLSDGTLLASKAKGIYKPEGNKYALSVRQSIGGPYQDRPVEFAEDGTWTFEYFQESHDPGMRDSHYTNRGLIQCWQDVVPVGVFIQVTPKPRSTYRVLGLALVSGYDDGYFCLQGISPTLVRDSSLHLDLRAAITPQFRADAVSMLFDPRRVEDARRKVIAEITRRQGQQGFRRTLLQAYKTRCVVTGYDAEDALEAAHIIPYRGPMTNHPSNGLLLRADIHNLFDLGFVGVKPSDAGHGSIIISRELEQTQYWALRGAGVDLPAEEAMRPSRDALEHHLEASGLASG